MLTCRVLLLLGGSASFLLNAESVSITIFVQVAYCSTPPSEGPSGIVEKALVDESETDFYCCTQEYISMELFGLINHSS